MIVRRLRALAAALVTAALVVGAADPAAAAPRPDAGLSSETIQALREVMAAQERLAKVRTEMPGDADPSFPPGRFTPPEPRWDGESGVVDTGDPRMRALVVDIADQAADVEVREAAEAALAAGTPEAVQEFLVSGQDEAEARAKARKAKTAKENKARITAMAGTGGPIFNAEVQRVLRGSDYERESFLIYGADLARARDEKSAADAKARAEQLRARVQMLAGLADSEVARAAQAALAAGDAAISAFVNGGYAEAARKDAEAREKYLREQRVREDAAEALSELARRAARANEARRNLVIAHGEGVRALRRSANALTSAGNEARRAEQILAANTAGNNHPADAYDGVKAEVVRQVGYAEQAADRRTAGVGAGHGRGEHPGRDRADLRGGVGRDRAGHGAGGGGGAGRRHDGAACDRCHRGHRRRPQRGGEGEGARGQGDQVARVRPGPRAGRGAAGRGGEAAGRRRQGGRRPHQGRA